MKFKIYINIEKDGKSVYESQGTDMDTICGNLYAWARNSKDYKKFQEQQSKNIKF